MSEIDRLKSENTELRTQLVRCVRALESIYKNSINPCSTCATQEGECVYCQWGDRWTFCDKKLLNVNKTGAQEVAEHGAG